MSDPQDRYRPATLQEWAAFWAELDEDVTCFFDYLEAGIEEETDIGMRVVMQEMFKDLRTIVQASV